MGMSIFEKLSVIFELLIHSPFAMISLLFCILFIASLSIRLYVNKKYIQFIFPIGYLVFFILLLSCYHHSMINSFSLFIDDLFFKVYFPSIALYFMLLLINALVLVFFMVMKKGNQYFKIITIVSFSLLQFLFALFCSAVTKEGLVLNDWDALYQNKTILSILEVSMGIFLVWVILLLIGFALYMINKRWGEKEDQIVISHAVWNQLETMIKGNLLKLSEEVEQLKRESEQDKQYMLTHFQQIEEKLEKTSQYVLTELKEATDHTNNRTMRQEFYQLREYVEHNQRLITIQLEQIRKEPFTDVKELKEKFSALENLVIETNERMKYQMASFKQTSPGEMEVLKEQMNQVEQLLKRYMVEMNYQLVQTRKELLISKHHE